MEAQWSHAVSSLAFVITMASVATGCGQIQFYAVYGFVSSINYPNEYPHNSNCTYSILSPLSSIGSVFIGFTEIDTEPNYDRIEIWCSTDSNNRRRFTGQYTSLPSFTLYCYEVKVNFRTDGSVTKRGFKLFFYWISTEREKTTTAPTTKAPTTTAPTTTAPTTTAPKTTAPTTTAPMTTAPTTSASLQTTFDSSDVSYGYLNAVLDKIFAVLGARTSVLLNLAFGCLLCLSLIAIFVAICRRKRRNSNKTRFSVAGAEEEEEETRERSNGHYSLDPMRKGKRQKSVESFKIQEDQRDSVSENDYANYGAEDAAAVDAEDVYECIDDIRH